MFLLARVDGKSRLEMFNLPSLSNRDLERLFERNPVNPDVTWMAGYERFKDNGDLHAFMKSIDHVREELAQRLKPLWDHLDELPEKITQLRISASGALSVIPFAMLPMGSSAKAMVIDRFAVEYETGLPSEARANSRPNACSELLAIVDPRQDLKFARTEAEAVADCFRQPSTLSGLDAKKESVLPALKTLSEDAQLHFICHGQYTWRHPEASSLELAGEDTLSLVEIAEQLKFPSGTKVTLSACETGINEFKQLPEESYGLPAAFLAAGADSVLAPFWPVSDFMTAQLMGEYYRSLQSGKPRAQALRSAQLAVRDRTENTPAAIEDSQSIRWGRKVARTADESDERIDLRHPYFWGGFALVN